MGGRAGVDCCDVLEVIGEGAEEVVGGVDRSMGCG